MTTNAIEKDKLRSSLAMTIVLISFSMLFATLFLGYALYRSSATTWPPMGLERISLTIPLISTALLILSSFTLNRAREAFDLDKKTNFKSFFLVTLILAIGFFGA